MLSIAALRCILRHFLSCILIFALLKGWEGEGLFVVADVYRSLKQQMTERMHGVLLWMCYFGELHEDLILLDIILLYYDFPLLQHLAI